MTDTTIRLQCRRKSDGIVICVSDTSREAEEYLVHYILFSGENMNAYEIIPYKER